MDSQSEIKPLNEASIRRIVAEQAITDLSSIVKELVDNALDAESTTIKIRLFGQGVDIVEVSDDGCGVPIHSRPHLATRYATSKISAFEDIYTGVGLSLGFRGEALFSLACLSEKLVVATRTEPDKMAQKLCFNADGSLDESSVESIHRKIGTTVAVVKPFYRAPARRADMSRRVRAERTKLFRLMESYAMFNVGVTMNLIDIVNGREDVALATSSTSTKIEETTSAVMGHKFLSTLAPIDLNLESVLDVSTEDGYGWGIKGLISKNPQAASSGRTVNCYSINGRVVEIPKITTLLRKIWAGFGGKKKPSCVLSFTLPNDKFDINLSPDKQQVLLSDEQEICQLLREHMTQFYSRQTNGIFQAQSIQLAEVEEDEDGDDKDRQMHKRRFAFVHDLSKAKMQHDLAGRESVEESKDGADNKREHPVDHDSGMRSRKTDNQRHPPQSTKEVAMQEEGRTASTPQNMNIAKKIYEFGNSGPGFRFREKMSDLEHRKWTEIQSKFKGTSCHDDIQSASSVSEPSGIEHSKHSPTRAKNESLSSDDSRKELRHSKSRAKNGETEEECDIDRGEEGAGEEDEGEVGTRKRKSPSLERSMHQPVDDKSKKPKQSGTNRSTLSKSETERVRIAATQHSKHNIPVNSRQESPDASSNLKPPGYGERSLQHKESTKAMKKNLCKSGVNGSAMQSTDESKRRISEEGHGEASSSESSSGECDEVVSPSVVWKSFKSTEQASCSARRERLHMHQRKKDQVSVRDLVFKESPIGMEQGSEDVTNSVGAQQFSKDNIVSLSKNVFRDGMRVIGQFNLGFIICCCKKNNLWILDQHACDEKYNFEKLCRETTFHEQKLLRPMPLDLSPMEEACILDHRDVFEANGFHFDFKPDAPIRKRLFLTALPHSGAQDGRKAVQFGKEDVRALCSMLSDGSSYDGGDGGTGTAGEGKFGNNAVRRYASTASNQPDLVNRLVARLPKAIAMFASRSCRTSIMIGTALSQKEMEKIVKRLADVEHPWNCPHGRPTMRHVGDVLPMMLNDERKVAEHITGPTSAVTPMTQDDFQDD